VERMKKLHMPNLKGGVRKAFGSLKSSTVRIGGYSVFAVIIVIAIAVAINYFVSALPSTVTQLDMTSNQLYSVSDQTKKIVGDLDQDVTVYWVTRSGYEDSTLENMLSLYGGLNSHLTVVKKDPDVNPTFVKQYSDTTEDNSLIVVCGDRDTYVANSDIFVYDYSNYYYDGTYDVSFDGENALTSAISYVTSEDLPKVYALEGHGESELSDTFSTAVEKENIDLESLSLLTLEAVPEDADCILIYAPTSDISADEKDRLLTYLQGGGTMLLVTNPPQDGVDMTNLYALMAEYGAIAQDGIVLEGDSNLYAWGAPHYLLPTLNSHDITDPLIDGNYYVLLPIAQGLTVAEDLRDTLTVTQLLTTSDSAFSKLAGYSMQSYEKEDGDLDGPFALGLAITETLSDDAQTQIVWFSSAALLDDSTNTQVSGGNLDLFVNAMDWMCAQESSISIRAKSLDTEYLTVPSGAASLLSVLIVGLIPLGYLSIGIVTAVRRKRK
jgi:ABC-2 type transport system permease protein